jgi:hypothetical protein
MTLAQSAGCTMLALYVITPKLAQENKVNLTFAVEL